MKRLYKEGRYAEAIPLARKALKITEEAVGKEHLSTATCLDNLAGLYYSMGRYEDALPLLRKELEIHRKFLGAHPLTARSLKSLAVLYISIGQLEKAIPLLEEVVNIYRKTVGENHPLTAASLNNLAGLYWRKGRSEEAVVLLKRAIAIYRNLPSSSLDLATTLNTLAAVYQSMRRLRQALPLLEEALKINRMVLGDHPFTARSLNNLAVSYIALGRVEEAEPLLKQALRINRKILGEEHPSTALTLDNLVMLYAIKGEIDRALKGVEAAERSKEGFIRYVLPGLSESQIIAYLSGNKLINPYLLSLCREVQSEKIIYKAFASVLRYKRYELLSLAYYQRFEPPELLRRRELAQLIMAGPKGISIPLFRKRIEQLKRELTIQSRWTDITPERVARAIPKKYVLIEFVRYEVQNVSYYLAFILHGDGKKPEALDLGEAAFIDDAIKDWLKTMETRKGKLVTDLLFKPLIPKLSAKNIIISPDGKIDSVSFSALPDEKGGYLGETYRFSYLPSGRDLLLWDEEMPPSCKTAVIIANPSFSWEAKLIAELLRERGIRPSIYSGDEANKSALISVEAPYLLHIAAYRLFTPKSDNPLRRSGLILADGPVTSLELAGLNLGGTELVVLSTYSREKISEEWIYPLAEVLLLCGARSIIVNLWDIPDEDRRGLLTDLYQRWLSEESKGESLFKASLDLLPPFRGGFICIGRPW